MLFTVLILIRSQKPRREYSKQYGEVLISRPLATFTDSSIYIYAIAIASRTSEEVLRLSGISACVPELSDMGKDTGFVYSHKTWLCNAALFALICAAFAAGILLGPVIASRGKEDLKEVRCTNVNSPDAAWKEQIADSKCISRKDLAAFMNKWSLSLDDLIEDKMVNVSRVKINPAIRKLSRARDAAAKKALKGIVTNVVSSLKSNL